MHFYVEIDCLEAHQGGREKEEWGEEFNWVYSGWPFRRRLRGKINKFDLYGLLLRWLVDVEKPS